MKSGKLYELIGRARCVDNPNNIKIVYKQLYESNIKGTDSAEHCEYGSLWVRNEDEFYRKFKLDDKNDTMAGYLPSNDDVNTIINNLW